MTASHKNVALSAPSRAPRVLDDPIVLARGRSAVSDHKNGMVQVYVIDHLVRQKNGCVEWDFFKKSNHDTIRSSRAVLRVPDSSVVVGPGIVDINGNRDGSVHRDEYCQSGLVCLGNRFPGGDSGSGVGCVVVALTVLGEVRIGRFGINSTVLAVHCRLERRRLKGNERMKRRG